MSEKASSPLVLVVEDDLLFRDVLQQCLRQKGYEVIGVGNAALAKNSISLDHPNFVISDIQMPGESGFDLLHWTKQNYPSTHFVLMTGFSEILNSVDAANAGAAGFLAKPFHKEDLIKLLEEIQHHAENPPEDAAPEEEAETELKYCKVSIEDFIFGSQLKHSIYVRIARGDKGRYLKIAHSGEDLTPERIKAYKEKGVSHLYLEKADYQEYLGLNIKVAGLASKSDKILLEKKMRFLRHTLELVNQQFINTEVSREDFESASTLVESSVNLLMTQDNGYKLLESLKSISDEFYAHSAAVSMICTLIAKKLGWSSPKVIYKASMAGLLHDTGKKQLPLELIKKRRSEMSAEERELYETHPVRGMEILNDLQFIPSDVIQAVYQHHERSLGSGFPLHLTDTRIIPIAKVVAVADEFVNLYLTREGEPPVPALSALERLVTFQSNSLSKEVVQALCAVFNSSHVVGLEAKK